MAEFWIILDANFLMIPESFGVDIFEELDRIVDREYVIVVPEVVVEELDRLSEEGSYSERKAASVALELISDFKKVPSEMEADDEILRLARSRESAVGTNDSELKKRLLEDGIPVIYLRQRSHLEVKGKI